MVVSVCVCKCMQAYMYIRIVFSMWEKKGEQTQFWLAKYGHNSHTIFPIISRCILNLLSEKIKSAFNKEWRKKMFLISKSIYQYAFIYTEFVLFIW